MRQSIFPTFRKYALPEETATVPARLPENEQIPQYESAISANGASFSLLIEILNKMKQQDPDKCRALAWYYPRIVDAFEQKYGRITHMYVNGKDGVILTSQHQLFLEYAIKKDAKVEHLLMRCDQMAIEAKRLLQGGDLKACSQILYVAAKSLLCIKKENNALFNEAKSISKETTECDTNSWQSLTLIEEHLDYAEKYHRRAALLSAQRYNVSGMVPSIFLILLVLLFRDRIVPVQFSTELLASIFGGGLGAAVSIMWRMSHGNSNVKYETGRVATSLAGFFRPLLGAIFGAVLYAFIQSNLLPLEVAAEVETLVFSYFSFGFLAGFSERWAPDMLTITTDRLPGNGGAQENEIQATSRQVPGT